MASKTVIRSTDREVHYKGPGFSENTRAHFQSMAINQGPGLVRVFRYTVYGRLINWPNSIFMLKYGYLVYHTLFAYS